MTPSETTCTCGRPTAGAILCPRCKTTLGYALVNIGVYWADLETLASKRARYGSTAAKGSIGKEQPLPVDLRFINQPEPKDGERVERRSAKLAPASQLKWDTWQVLVRWSRKALDSQPILAGPLCADPAHCRHATCANLARRRRIARNVPGMVHYLARQHDWLVAQAWIPQCLDELLDLERRLARLIDRPADRWYAGKCSARTVDGECDAELYATADSGTLRCRACGAEHDIAARRDFLLREARSILVTATEAASALMAWTDYDGSETKLVDRIRKWRDRGRLEVADVTSLHGRDRHLYRLGDVQELLVDDAQTRQNRRLDASA